MVPTFDFQFSSLRRSPFGWLDRIVSSPVLLSSFVPVMLLAVWHPFLFIWVSSYQTRTCYSEMNRLTIIISAMICPNLSFSQVDLGLKGGINLATVRYINADNSRARLGWNIGATATILVQENLFARPELLYSSKGFGYAATQTSRAGSLRLNYINIPLLIGYRPTVKTAIMAGPEIGLLQKAVSKSQGVTTDMTNFYRRFDIGFDLGFAYSFSKLVGIEARYNHGFKNLVNVLITDNNGNVIGQGKTGANRVLQVGILYSLSQ